MDVREWHDEIVFLHKVKPGAADRSYGIQVAKLAGLPAAVLGRAREVLALLEKSDGRKSARNDTLDELPLFAVTRARGARRCQAAPRPWTRPWTSSTPTTMTPRSALDALYRLKSLRRESSDPERES